jgi:cation diffusion facilitator CzcD-associated flavoprotein CzcO
LNDVETIIIGAGPYGLSMAAHLRDAGLPYRIFGTPLETWRSFMPRGMILKSDHFATSIWDPRRRYTIERYAAEKGVPYQPYGRVLSLAEFLEYGDWFLSRAVSDVTDVKVDRVDAAGDGYRVDLADGTSLTSRQVIIATGYMNFQSTPPELAEVPEPIGLHSASLHDLSGFAGRDVAIVGAGQSALETAALMHEAGARVRLLVRKDKVKWNPPPHPWPRSVYERVTDPKAGLGSGWKEFGIGEFPRLFRFAFSAEKRHRFVANSWGPTGADWLRPRLEGKVEVLTGVRVRKASAHDGRARITVEGPGGSKEIVADHVVAATGYKVDLDRMSVLSPQLKARIVREGPAPKLDAWFESSLPGLFMVGVASAPTFGPVMRFVFGAKHAAPLVTQRLKWRERVRRLAGLRSFSSALAGEP